MKRLVLALCLLGALLPLQACAAAPAAWPAWDRFAAGFVQDNGRVVDWTDNARTVSEGQAYGLFFALVANDRQRFDRILQWTQLNLAQGDLSRHLPAWLWGTDPEQRQRVLDANSASDADLWIAYALLEAGRLWKRADYRQLGRAVLTQVKAKEVLQAHKQTLLLPGPAGFELAEGVRLNPSYLPPFQLAYLANEDRRGPWAAILSDYLNLLQDIAPSGCVPDWFVLTPDGPRMDVQSDGRGSYDAVRAYLWAGISVPVTRAGPRMLKLLAPYADFIRRSGRLPERCYPDGRAPVGQAPAGIEAALLPFYQSLGARDLLAAAQERIRQSSTSGMIGQPARYYEQVLTLFGQGWLEQRYRFDAYGRVRPQWQG